MKSMYMFSYILLLFSYNLVQKNTTLTLSENKNCKLSDSSNVYRITEIDSIENIYILLAKRDDLTYKIVSFHDSLKCVNSIKIGQSYNLLLKSVFPETYFQKDRVSFVRYGSVKVPLGGGQGIVWDLFSIQNLKGLCLY